MPRAPSSHMKPPALNFALAAALAAFALAAFSPGLLNDGDTYWHIRAGEWMIAHSAVLRSDVFSYTASGNRWHTQEWLAEILMALSWRAGWPGVHLLFAGCAGLAAGVVAFFVRKRVDFVAALLTVVLGLACVTGGLLARPHVLALPLLAIWTAGLVAAREQNKPPSCWLIAVMPLWANLHGSFAFGLALAAALAIEAIVLSEQRKKATLGWSVFLLGAAASAMITPFGFHTLLFPFQLSTMQALGHVGEWQASDFSRLTPFSLALLAALFVLGRGQVKVPPLRLLLLLGLTALALMHARHQMLLGLCAPILLASALASTWPAGKGSQPPVFAVMAVLVLTGMIAVRLAVPVTRGDDAMSPGSVLAHVPRFVRETPVLNDYAFGGYLIWNGVKPFIDSRADLYGDIFLENYATLVSPDKDALAATLALHHVRWTIFPRQAPVVKLLDATPGWRRFYTDKLAVVHVHD